jgi:hypothetical protein
MKAKRLPLFSALASLLLLTVACKKTEEPGADAILTGYDPRLCGCCGGLMLTLSGNPQPFADEFKLVDNSSELGISHTESFPIRVKVKYTVLANTCGGAHVKITSLQRQ